MRKEIVIKRKEALTKVINILKKDEGLNDYQSNIDNLESITDEFPRIRLYYKDGSVFDTIYDWFDFEEVQDIIFYINSLIIYDELLGTKSKRFYDIYV